MFDHLDLKIRLRIDFFDGCLDLLVLELAPLTALRARGGWTQCVGPPGHRLSAGQPAGVVSIASADLVQRNGCVGAQRCQHPQIDPRPAHGIFQGCDQCGRKRPQDPVFAVANLDRGLCEHGEVFPLHPISGSGRFPIDCQAAHFTQITFRHGACFTARSGDFQDRLQGR